MLASVDGINIEIQNKILFCISMGINGSMSQCDDGQRSCLVIYIRRFRRVISKGWFILQAPTDAVLV